MKVDRPDTKRPRGQITQQEVTYDCLAAGETTKPMNTLSQDVKPSNGDANAGTDGEAY